MASKAARWGLRLLGGLAGKGRPTYKGINEIRILYRRSTFRYKGEGIFNLQFRVLFGELGALTDRTLKPPSPRPIARLAGLYSP